MLYKEIVLKARQHGIVKYQCIYQNKSRVATGGSLLGSPFLEKRLFFEKMEVPGRHYIFSIRWKKIIFAQRKCIRKKCFNLHFCGQGSRSSPVTRSTWSEGAWSETLEAGIVQRGAGSAARGTRQILTPGVNKKTKSCTIRLRFEQSINIFKNNCLFSKIPEKYVEKSRQTYFLDYNFFGPSDPKCRCVP